MGECLVNSISITSPLGLFKDHTDLFFLPDDIYDLPRSLILTASCSSHALISLVREAQLKQNSTNGLTASSQAATASMVSKRPSTATHHGGAMVKVEIVAESNDDNNKKEGGSRERRDLVFAAAAAAACYITRASMAEEAPKPGSPEAKKKYAPVCVTMPTARICHN
ncbi:hypothetical protein Nepgr_012151 [Nepenthes gracilis]|uniref:Uncharacterized protein n=1 Tax=Nepenthes gracilis TaxID=150966 RepID=A0AAD3SF97_NEPGR|nr:hypothetical protein Nepgr_012151 [Nepenthes gracilis]